MLHLLILNKLMQVIPRQLCDNAGFDATDVLNKLRQKHAAGLFCLSFVMSCLYYYLKSCEPAKCLLSNAIL